MNYQLLKNILSTLDQDHQSMLYDLMVQTLWSSDPVLERHCESLLERIPYVAVATLIALASTCSADFSESRYQGPARDMAKHPFIVTCKSVFYTLVHFSRL